MDGGGGENLMRAISARLSSSNLFRPTSGREVFSLSSNEEDDGEALKWAALEKLPTFARIRTGILTEDEGQMREIDVKKLGSIEKRNLVERLVKIAEEGNENFLLQFKERIDRVGLHLPTIDVRFEKLNVDAEAYVGGRGLPTIYNFFFNAFQSIPNSLGKMAFEPFWLTKGANYPCSRLAKPLAIPPLATVLGQI